MKFVNFLISRPSSDLYTGSRLINTFKPLPLTYKFLTASQPDYVYTILSVPIVHRTRFSSVVTPAPPSVLYLRHYKSPTAPLDMHHLTCGINSLLHSVNLILFTLLLVHLILRMIRSEVPSRIFT